MHASTRTAVNRYAHTHNSNAQDECLLSCIRIQRTNGHQSQLPGGFLPFNHFRIHSIYFSMPMSMSMSMCVILIEFKGVFCYHFTTYSNTNDHIFLSSITLSSHTTIRIRLRYDTVCLKKGNLDKLYGAYVWRFDDIEGPKCFWTAKVYSLSNPWFKLYIVHLDV